MASPTAPLKSSADATSGTTIELRWRAPDDDGGFAILEYDVERSTDGGGFVSVATVTAPLTELSESGLVPQTNYAYRISATNTNSETGPFSDTASTTTATSEAQTIKELLFDNWALTGELANATTGDMTEPVHFYDRGQVPGNKFPKAITVQKINAIGNENIIEHPTFFEQSEVFEITCFLQVPDAADDVFSVWIDLMQQMTGEVSRILKTVYSPSTSTGEFFKSTSAWIRDDTFFPDDPELTRTLRFTLTRILSDSDEVFTGYPGSVAPAGVLVFDTSASSGDSLPTEDYVYTQVYRVEVLQGWRNLPYITTDSPDTTAIPNFFRGAFSGRFTALMDLKKSDITPATLNSLSQIFRPQTTGELGTAVFLHNVGNTETSPVILQESIPVNITSIEKISENEDLVKFHLRGNLTGPTTFSTFETAVDMLYEDGVTMEYEDNVIMNYG
jgi:hypothetical protein